MGVTCLIYTCCWRAFLLEKIFNEVGCRLQVCHKFFLISLQIRVHKLSLTNFANANDCSTTRTSQYIDIDIRRTLYVQRNVPPSLPPPMDIVYKTTSSIEREKMVFQRFQWCSRDSAKTTLISKIGLHKASRRHAHTPHAKWSHLCS